VQFLAGRQEQAGGVAGLRRDRALDQVGFAEKASDKRVSRTLVHLAGRPNLVDPAMVLIAMRSDMLIASS
jgi:hypothetical protein